MLSAPSRKCFSRRSRFRQATSTRPPSAAQFFDSVETWRRNCFRWRRPEKSAKQNIGGAKNRQGFNRTRSALSGYASQFVPVLPPSVDHPSIAHLPRSAWDFFAVRHFGLQVAFVSTRRSGPCGPHGRDPAQKKRAVIALFFWCLLSVRLSARYARVRARAQISFPRRWPSAPCTPTASGPPVPPAHRSSRSGFPAP
jgi:hypothetical protein